ncbi:cysteine proteinase [Hypoxylon sp. NC1633]|nr:cysteine proteinase [Hypoxylon sp. NC1633]
MPFAPGHNWRNPSHCRFCNLCRVARLRKTHEAHLNAHIGGKNTASEIGNSSFPTPAPILRSLRVPRSNRTVTIQLPDSERRVAPTDRPTPRPSKRTFRLFSKPTPDEQSGFPERVDVSSAYQAAPPESNRSALNARYRRHRKLTQLGEDLRGQIPFGHAPYLYPPVPPLDPEIRERILNRSYNRMAAVPTVQTRPTNTMPGAWPSEADEEDAEASISMPRPVRVAFDMLARIWENLGSRVFRSNVPAPPAPSPPEQGPSPKRRRLDSDSTPSTPVIVRNPTFSLPSPGSSIDDEDDFMDIDGPMDFVNRGKDGPGQVEASPPESPVLSPNSAALAAARASKHFATGKKVVPKQAQGPIQTQLPPITPPPEAQKLARSTEEAEPKLTWGPLPQPKYKNIHEFFQHDDELCLPGLDRVMLSPSSAKIFELGSQREERLRRKIEKAEQERREREERIRIEREAAERELREKLRIEEEEWNEKLRPLGLRRPKTTLITPLSEFWDDKAVRSPNEGYAERSKWQGALHREGVELTPRDFGRLVPPSAWLNDNAIQAALVHLATYVNDAAGVVPKTSTPKCVALSSQYWSNYLSNPRQNIYPRGLSRAWGMTPGNFLDVDTVLIPVNEHNHWTVIVIRPSRRTVTYLDSFQTNGVRHLQDVQNWMKSFLGDIFVPNDWRTERYVVPSQSNGYDCGVFVITNSIYVSLGIDPSGYTQDDMPLQRRRIAAMLLHGGFTGPFDLSGL